MGRYRSRSRSRSPVRGKRYDESPPHRRRSVRDHRRSPGPTGLLVRNISLRSRADDLRVPFERYGPVKDVYLPKNYYTGEPRGFGFVKFHFSEDAAEAKHELDHTVIGGREIRVVFAEENRKTPHEMRRMSRVSSRDRESYGRRSRSRSPRRRRSSYSPSPSPPRRGSRNERGRDDHHSPRGSRSVSRSVSPSNERKYRSKQRSPRRSRSISDPLSPLDERNLKSSTRVHDNTLVDEVHVRDRSQIPSQRNSPSPSRSRSQSYSSR